MIIFNRTLKTITLFLVMLIFSVNSYALIHGVAAENVYASIAQSLGGEKVTVDAILSNPAEDPHLFTLTSSAAKLVSTADIIILNGGDYDPWMLPLLKINTEQKKEILNVGLLIQSKTGDNPHFWYNPVFIPLIAEKISAMFSKLDPQNKLFYEKKLTVFKNDYQKLVRKITVMKQTYPSIDVIATEPVYNGMVSALGWTMHGKGVQISNMNDVSPSISALKSFEVSLASHQLKLFFTNKQVSNSLTNQLTDKAKENNIAIIPVSELMPQNTTYIDWMIMQLDAIDSALKLKERKK